MSMVLTWEGGLRKPVANGCSCAGWTPTCYEAHAFEPGSYLFTVPFAESLPASESYSKQLTSEGITAWRGDLGFTSFDRSESFVVDYRGQTEIVLAFR
jgi:hypothetical protein